MKINPYSIFMKWGIDEPTPLEILTEKVEQLEERIKLIEQEIADVRIDNPLKDLLTPSKEDCSRQQQLFSSTGDHDHADQHSANTTTQ